MPKTPRKFPSKKTKPLRDTEVDNIRQAVRALGLSNAEIYHNTYLSRGTIAKLLEWRPGKKRTKYPAFMTLKGVAAAGGMEYRLVKKEEKDE